MNADRLNNYDDYIKISAVELSLLASSTDNYSMDTIYDVTGKIIELNKVDDFGLPYIVLEGNKKAKMNIVYYLHDTLDIAKLKKGNVITVNGYSISQDKNNYYLFPWDYGIYVVVT
jgi:hypothetical protein